MKVSLGQFVIIPLRNQHISGVVTELHERVPTYTAKPIETALELKLPKWQMNLFLWMSKKYVTSITNVLQMAIPERAWPEIKKRKSREKKEEPTEHPLQPPVKISQKVLAFAQELMKSEKTKLVLEKALLPRAEFYAALRATVSPQKQLLFLVPETFHAEVLKNNFNVFHGELSPTRKASAWNLILESSLKTIVGTRTSLFLPFKNLGAIVLDFEHSESYLEKRSPKYHALDIANQIAAILQIPLIVISAAPRSETWNNALQRKYEKQEWNGDQPREKIIDMANERRKGNNGIFAEETLSSIARCLTQNEQVLLFTHRTGQAGALLCRDCGSIFRCEICKNSLAVHTGNVLKCHSCKTLRPVPRSCPQCGNVKLKELGFGTEAVEQEIKKVFGKAVIFRLDNETKSDKNREEIKQCDVIVATSLIDKPWELSRLGLSVAVMPDSLLQFPHFRAAERLCQLLMHIKNLTKTDGEMIIQTFLPGHALFRTIAKNEVDEFYDKELAVRKQLRLPPFDTTI